jgi:cullin-associated NEDD8-dissociated protein 1
MMDSLTSTAPEPDIKDEYGVRKSLAILVPRLGKSMGKLLNNKAITLPTKQASITLLSAVVSVLHGDLGDTLRIVIDPLVDAVKGGSGFAAGGNVIVASAAGGSAATATGSSVRIEVLRLLAKIFDNHSISVVGEYLESLVPALSTAVNERGYKISWEALGTVIAAVRLLTSDGAQPYAKYLQTLYDVVLEKVQSSDTDLDVREKAILTLGVILSRTSGDETWIGKERRSKALVILLERLRNETTRITAARAIEGIARNTNVPTDVDAAWVEAVVAECGAQLRKANRSLRAASLDTLRSISQNENCRSKLSKESKKELVAVTTPLLVVGDMHLLNLSIAIMRQMMLNRADGVGATPDVIRGICDLIKSSIGSGVVLDNLLALVGTIGEVDPAGKKDLMKDLLRKVGVTGETAIVAKVVAQLFCSGGGDKGGFAIGVKDFVGEVRSVEDERRKSLALMVLGEIGLRM